MATATENLNQSTPAETALLRGECEHCKAVGLIVGGLCLHCERAARDARAIDEAEHTAAVLDGRLQAAHRRIGAMESELAAAQAATAKVRAELDAANAESSARIDAIDSIRHGGIRLLLMMAASAEAPDIREIVGKLPAGTRSYAELQDLVRALAGLSDDYEAANEIEGWLRAWN